MNNFNVGDVIKNVKRNEYFIVSQDEAENCLTIRSLRNFCDEPFLFTADEYKLVGEAREFRRDVEHWIDSDPLASHFHLDLTEVIIDGLMLRRWYYFTQPELILNQFGTVYEKFLTTSFFTDNITPKTEYDKLKCRKQSAPESVCACASCQDQYMSALRSFCEGK